MMNLILILFLSYYLHFKNYYLFILKNNNNNSKMIGIVIDQLM